MVHRLFEINSDNPFFWLTMLCEICYFRRSGQAVSSSRRALSTYQVTIKKIVATGSQAQDLPLVPKSNFGLNCNFDQYLEWEVKVSHGRLNEVKRWRELSWIFSGHREDYSWVARFLRHSGEKEVRSVSLELVENFILVLNWLFFGQGGLEWAPETRDNLTQHGEVTGLLRFIENWVAMFVCLFVCVLWLFGLSG